MKDNNCCAKAVKFCANYGVVKNKNRGWRGSVEFF
jgi:hypothetical protein